MLTQLVDDRSSSANAHVPGGLPIEARCDLHLPPLISFVVPCCNEEPALAELYARLGSLADLLAVQSGYRAEMVLVDDGSRDGTWDGICSLADEDLRVHGVRLSRNFGFQSALACGYAEARGNAIVSLDADLQDPPEVVPEMVRAWLNGADVVFGVRQSRRVESWFKRGTAWGFYWLLHRLGAVHVRRNVGDFRLLSRRAWEAVRAISGSRPFFRDSTGWVGFATADVRYERRLRQTGTTKFPVARLCALAVDAIISSSMRPLYFPWAAATLVAALGLVLVFANGTATIGVILLCASLLLAGQAVQGLYLARVLEEGRGRPLFLVAERTGHAAEPAHARDTVGHGARRG